MQGAASSSSWRAARRVLAIRLDNLGDVLMTTPALAALKHAAPDMHVALLGSPGVAAAQRHMPCVDEVIAYHAPWTQGAAGEPEADLALIERLRQGRFDAAIVFTVATQSPLAPALMCRLAGIPLRLAHCRENPYGLLTDWRPETDRCEPGMRHEVRRQLDLVASVGFMPAAAPGSERLVFRLDDDDRAGLRSRFELALRAAGDVTAAANAPYFVVHPGATAASRRYPAAQFGIAAAAIARASGRRAVFCGGPDEQDLAEEAMAAMRRCGPDWTLGAPPPVSLAGGLSLGEFAVLIAGAEVLVCNNSGPAHLAAALGRPVAVTYALTNPQHTPWGVPARVLSHEVPCRDCLKSTCPLGHHECLTGVPAEAVAEAALALMGCEPPAARPVLLRPRSLMPEAASTPP